MTEECTGKITLEHCYKGFISEFLSPCTYVIIFSHSGLRHKVKSNSPLKVKMSYLSV